MTNNSGFDFLRFRDGTSQQQRINAALDPDYFALDERSLPDLLEFARQFAGTLRFYNRQNKGVGDWSPFLEGNLNEMLAYLQDPTYFDHQPGKKALFSRPHFALLLTFLSLLQQAQVQMNTLTRRQLDFYYQKALGLQPQPGHADHVHVLAELESNTEQLLIPEGTLLYAGDDEDGDPILYQTEETFLANQARVGKLMSLFVEKEIDTLEKIRLKEADPARHIFVVPDPTDVFLKVLEVVYRKDGTLKTPRTFPNNEINDRILTKNLIEELIDLSTFIKDSLHLRITSFQRVMDLYQAYENPLNWHRKGKRGGINDYLLKAARRLGNDFDLLSLTDPLDFDLNLATATGLSFSDLEGVDDIYDLYHAHTRLHDQDGDLPNDPIIDKIINDLGLGEYKPVLLKAKFQSQWDEFKESSSTEFNVTFPASTVGFSSFRTLPINTGPIEIETHDPNLKLQLSHDDPTGDPELIIRQAPLSGNEEISFELKNDNQQLVITLPLIPASVQDFESMMQIRMDTLGYLNEIRRILNEAMIVADVQPKLIRKGYEKGKTLAHIFEEMCNLPTPTTGSTVYPFPKQDKELLTVRLAADRPMPMSDLLAEWHGNDRKDRIGQNVWKGGFSLAVDDNFNLNLDEFDRWLSLAATGAANGELSIDLPGNKEGHFLRVKYLPTNGVASAELMVDDNGVPGSEPAFDLSEPGRLLIQLPNDAEPVLVGRVLLMWNRLIKSGAAKAKGFSMVSPDDMDFAVEPTDLVVVELEGQLSVDIPGDVVASFMRISYAEGRLSRAEVIINDAETGNEPSFDLQVPGRLVIQLPFGKNTTATAIHSAWTKLPEDEREGFSIASPANGDTFHILPFPNPDEPVELKGVFSTQIDGDREGAKIKVNYQGPWEAEVTIKQNKVKPYPWFAFPLERRLVINIPKDPTPVADVLAEWNKLPDKKGFSLYLDEEFSISPLVGGSLPPALQKQRTFLGKIPGDTSNSFLDITYRGSQAAPEVIIKEGAGELFDLSVPGRLIIHLTSNPMPVDDILAAWTDANGFSIITPSDTSFAIPPLKTPSLALMLDEQRVFTAKLVGNDPGTFLRVNYHGLAPRAEVTIALDTSKVDPEFEFPPNKEGKLTIIIADNPTPATAIIEYWGKEAEHHGFSIEASDYSDFSISVSGSTRLKPLTRYSGTVPGDQSGQFLKLDYIGLSSSPKVRFEPKLPEEDQAFSFVDGPIADDYYKIKAGQLSQVESYFRMQAEDFFFMRDLYQGTDDEWYDESPAWKWKMADELLLKAHRELFGPEAVPQLSSWKDLFIARDAGQVKVPGFDGGDFSRWKTFGRKPDPSIAGDREYIERGEFGFALASPSLSMAEGNRRISLKLTFLENSFDRARLLSILHALERGAEQQADEDDLVENVNLYPFRIEISTEKQWVHIPRWLGFDIGDTEPSMTITLLIDEEVDPIAPVADDPCPSPWPVLKLIVARQLEDISLLKVQQSYELLTGLQLVRLDLEVEVQGLKNVQIQTPRGAARSSSPFAPFGQQPEVGDRCLISHPELAAQRLDALSLELDWKNFPDQELEAYYEPYHLIGSGLNIPRIDNDSFEVDLTLRDAHRWFAMPPSGRKGQQTGHKLFSAGKQNNLLQWTARNRKAIHFEPTNVLYDRKPNPKMADTVLEADRYLEIRLRKPDFLHSRYSTLLTLKAINGDPNTKISTENLLVEEIEVIEGESTSTKNVAKLKGIPYDPSETELESPSPAFQIYKITAEGQEKIASFSYNATANQLEFDSDVAPPSTSLVITYKGPIVLRESLQVMDHPELGDIANRNVIQLRGLPFQDTNQAKIKVHKNNASREPITEVVFDTEKNQLLVPATVQEGTSVTVSYHGPLVLQDPYTPVLQSLKVNYKSSASILLSKSRETTHDQLFHIHPFGMSQIEKSAGEEGFLLIPRYDHEGQLYVGLEQLQPPQLVSLLIQMAEGSANPDLPPEKVEWAYLAGHDWIPLGDERIRKDTTHRLRESGIVQLAIPDDASTDHSRMPKGLHWIRARVKGHSAGLNDSIAIHTQGIKAIWLDQGLDASHLGRSLPPDRISSPRSPIPGLSQFLQPYSSFGGKSREKQAAFYQRVSERLRHKNRALTIWDFERLILEKFPDIYRAKVLAADMLETGSSPGVVTAIVIPDIRYRRPFDPFEPKVPYDQLQKIREFLQGLVSPFVQIQVKNPRFHYIHVRSPVKFRDMQNFGFYADKLIGELKQFLSPWAFDHGSEISFGREVYLSMVVNFMESRPYVDYVDQPKLLLRERRALDGKIVTIGGLVSQAGTGDIQMQEPDIILVSDAEHTIDILDDSIPPGERVFSGVSYAKIELDLDVALDKESPNF